jgi:hypothetical protein
VQHSYFAPEKPTQPLLATFIVWIDQVLYKLSEHYYDWRWKIKTYAYASSTELGHDRDSFEYTPTPYRHLFRILRAIPQDVREGQLIDFGSGLGRVVVAAHRLGFKNPLGVELSQKLFEQARQNVGNLPVSLLHEDATRFIVPQNATIFFFFNPFGDETLRAVLNNIEDSIRKNPRPCVFAVRTIGTFERIIVDNPRIVREQSGSFRYPRAGWAIYRYFQQQSATDSAPRLSGV